MKLHLSELIPRSTASTRRFRFGHFLQTHHVTIKMLGRLFERFGHRDVDVMKAGVHFPFSEPCEKPAAASNCFSRSATPGLPARYALKSVERFFGILSD